MSETGTPLRVETSRHGEGRAVISLIGEVDVANTAQMREAALKLMEEGANRLVFDLSATEYMDSAGLGALVGLLKRLKESGGKMALAGARPRVERLFEITGLNQILRLCGDVSAALEEVGG